MGYSWFCTLRFLAYVRILLYLCKKVLTKNHMLMKKTIFLFAMCLMGMCSMYAACVTGTPILFYDVYAVMPLDDPDNGNMGGSPDPNQQIVGSIDGDDLNIVIGDGNEAEAGEVIVIDPETGEIIIDEEFVGQTSVTIPEPGAYTAYVVTDGGTYAGDFVVE